MWRENESVFSHLSSRFFGDIIEIGTGQSLLEPESPIRTKGPYATAKGCQRYPTKTFIHKFD